jgi:separase
VNEGPIQITSSLEIVFTLARAVLDPNDPHTYVTAYDHLSHASTIISTHSPINANCIRCLSSAFHHLAGSLYQSGKYGGATRFLRDSCAFGTKALEVKKLGDARVAQETEEQEAWRALETQLYRRWELLAVCYVKIGEKKVSHYVTVNARLH